MKSKVQLAVELILGVLVISFILSKVNLSEAIAILHKIDTFLLFVSILLYIFTILITAYGLKALFDSIASLTFMRWLKYYMITFSLGLVLPGRTGEFSIVYFMKKNNIEIGSTTALVIIDKLITLIIFGLVTLLGLFTILNSGELYVGLIAVLLILFVGCLIFSNLGKKLFNKILGKYSLNFASFHETSRMLLASHKDKLMINILVTIARPILNGLLIVILFASFDYNVSLFYAIIISSIALIASLVPLTPNGLGIREGVGLLLFSKIGVPFEASISMYLLILIMNYLTGALGVLYYFCTREKNLEISSVEQSYHK